MVILDMWQTNWLYKIDKDDKGVCSCAVCFHMAGRRELLKHGLDGFPQRQLNSIVKVIRLDLEVLWVQILIQIPL